MEVVEAERSPRQPEDGGRGVREAAGADWKERKEGPTIASPAGDNHVTNEAEQAAADLLRTEASHVNVTAKDHMQRVSVVTSVNSEAYQYINTDCTATTQPKETFTTQAVSTVISDNVSYQPNQDGSHTVIYHHPENDEYETDNPNYVTVHALDKNPPATITYILPQQFTQQVIQAPKNNSGILMDILTASKEQGSDTSEVKEPVAMAPNPESNLSSPSTRIQESDSRANTPQLRTTNQDQASALMYKTMLSQAIPQQSRDTHRVTAPEHHDVIGHHDVTNRDRHDVTNTNQGIIYKDVLIPAMTASPRASPHHHDTHQPPPTSPNKPQYISMARSWHQDTIANVHSPVQHGETLSRDDMTLSRTVVPSRPNLAASSTPGAAMASMVGFGVPVLAQAAQPSNEALASVMRDIPNHAMYNTRILDQYISHQQRTNVSPAPTYSPMAAVAFAGNIQERVNPNTPDMGTNSPVTRVIQAREAPSPYYAAPAASLETTSVTEASLPISNLAEGYPYPTYKTALREPPALYPTPAYSNPMQPSNPDTPKSLLSALQAPQVLRNQGHQEHSSQQQQQQQQQQSNLSQQSSSNSTSPSTSPSLSDTRDDVQQPTPPHDPVQHSDFTAWQTYMDTAYAPPMTSSSVLQTMTSRYNYQGAVVDPSTSTNQNMGYTQLESYRTIPNGTGYGEYQHGDVSVEQHVTNNMEGQHGGASISSLLLNNPNVPPKGYHGMPVSMGK